MASVIILLIYVVIFLIGAYKYCFYRPKNFPPGPPRLPFLGSYPFLFLLNFNNLHLAIQKLCKYYKSDVIGFYIGDALCVVANDQASVREVLFNSDFDGRNDLFIARLRSKNFNLRGIFFIDGLFLARSTTFHFKKHA